MALPKKNRIASRKEINRIFKDGRTVKGSFLFIKLLNSQKRYSRIAFVIPSKHAPLAVDRNRIKRILSEKVTRNPSLSEKQLDIIVYLFRKVSRIEISELPEDLEDLLSKI